MRYNFGGLKALKNVNKLLKFAEHVFHSPSIDLFMKRHKLVNNGGFIKSEVAYCSRNIVKFIKIQYTLDQRFQRAFKPKQPSAGRASEGGGTSGHPGP